MWRSMHVVALGCPDSPTPEQARAYTEFFNSLKTVIPCSSCAQGYADIVSAAPLPLERAVAGGGPVLFPWSVEVHNAVARKLGQAPMTPDFVQASYLFGDGPIQGGAAHGTGAGAAHGTGAGAAHGTGAGAAHGTGAGVPVLAAIVSVATLVALVATLLWLVRR
jgi:hypothetical protein